MPLFGSTNGIIAPRRGFVKHEFAKSVLTGAASAATIHYMKVRVVIVNTGACAELLAEPERFCSEARLLECRGIADPVRRRSSLAAELALSYALSGDKLLPPAYSRDEGGRPVIGGGYVSMTHSGAFAAAAFSPVPVGIDIEEPRAVSPAAERRMLSPRELAECERSADPLYSLRRFVTKEAFLKMTGEGVFGGLAEVYASDGRVFRRGVLSGFVREFDCADFVCRLVTESEAEAEAHFLITSDVDARR